MSSVGWIDFSRAHHNRVMSLLDMFRDEGVVDELGVGTIRDSLSDLLFPGTSTIQTRAKYFLIVPWIFQDIERRGRITSFLSELEESEIDITKVLRSTSKTAGIIGATLPNANPKRKPSSIYWNGLRTYGILHFKGSIVDYANHLKHHQKKLKNQRIQLIESDGNVPGDDRDANHLYQLHLWYQIPKPPEDWKTNLSIALSEEEARFLKERIVRSCPESLWACILNYYSDEAKSFAGIIDFLTITNLPVHLKEQVRLAVDFNTIMKGVLIRYNLLIQRNRENGRLDEIEPLWQDYWSEIQGHNWHQWATERLWHYCPYTQYPTKQFVERWIELVRAKTFDSASAEQLIKKRELDLKGISRARLQDRSIAQRQDAFSGIGVREDGSVEYLTYRWGTVRTFLNDIQNGLANNAAA